MHVSSLVSLPVHVGLLQVWRVCGGNLFQGIPRGHRGSSLRWVFSGLPLFNTRVLGRWYPCVLQLAIHSVIHLRLHLAISLSALARRENEER